MRPRGLSSSSPSSRKVGQVAVQKPQCTQVRMIFSDDGVVGRGELVGGEAGLHQRLSYIRPGLKMPCGSNCRWILRVRASTAGASGWNGASVARTAKGARIEGGVAVAADQGGEDPPDLLGAGVLRPRDFEPDPAAAPVVEAAALRAPRPGARRRPRPWRAGPTASRRCCRRRRRSCLGDLLPEAHGGLAAQHHLRAVLLQGVGQVGDARGHRGPHALQGGSGSRPRPARPPRRPRKRGRCRAGRCGGRGDLGGAAERCRAVTDMASPSPRPVRTRVSLSGAAGRTFTVSSVSAQQRAEAAGDQLGDVEAGDVLHRPAAGGEAFAEAVDALQAQGVVARTAGAATARTAAAGHDARRRGCPLVRGLAHSGPKSGGSKASCWPLGQHGLDLGHGRARRDGQDQLLGLVGDHRSGPRGRGPRRPPPADRRDGASQRRSAPASCWPKARP